jgi:hypothetical protein
MTSLHFDQSAADHHVRVPVAGGAVAELPIFVVAPCVQRALRIDGDGMEFARADGRHAVQFRNGKETGTAATAAMTKLAVHAERNHGRKAVIEMHQLCDHEVARDAVHTLRTCHPHTKTRARPPSRREKNLNQQQPQRPARDAHEMSSRTAERRFTRTHLPFLRLED